MAEFFQSYLIFSYSGSMPTRYLGIYSHRRCRGRHQIGRNPNPWCNTVSCYADTDSHSLCPQQSSTTCGASPQAWVRGGGWCHSESRSSSSSGRCSTQSRTRSACSLREIAAAREGRCHCLACLSVSEKEKMRLLLRASYSCTRAKADLLGSSNYLSRDETARHTAYSRTTWRRGTIAGVSSILLCWRPSWSNYTSFAPGVTA